MSYGKTRACAQEQHTACNGVTLRIVCLCGCHDDSFACKQGAHALCERGACLCKCGHKVTHETVAERQKWAA